MTCSDGKSFHFTANKNGNWNVAMTASLGEYFQCGEAREQSGYGIINFRALTHHGDIMASNNNMNGAWDRLTCCPDDAPRLVGMQTEEQSNYGIINVDMICDDPYSSSTRMQLTMRRSPMTNLLDVSSMTSMAARTGATMLALLSVS